jgi:hypothetical protein
VPAKDSGDPAKRRDHAARVAARRALAELLEPLAGFALDAGLSIPEVETLLRIAAVRSLAKRQREASQRVNISGIAASTGISRAEISRILKSPERAEVTTQPKARERRATNRILSAWHEDPQFTKPNGQPAELKIFGPGATFDALVKQHGRGLPTRAMLDELARSQALEVLPSQKVRAKALVAAERGATPQAIQAFGERAGQLLSTLLATMRDPDGHQFVTHIEGAVNSVEALPVLRREVAVRGSDFLASMRDTIDAADLPQYIETDARAQEWISIMVAYHEGGARYDSMRQLTSSRRNFRRAKKKNYVPYDLFTTDR